MAPWYLSWVFKSYILVSKLQIFKIDCFSLICVVVIENMTKENWRERIHSPSLREGRQEIGNRNRSQDQRGIPLIVLLSIVHSVCVLYSHIPLFRGGTTLSCLGSSTIINHSKSTDLPTGQADGSNSSIKSFLSSLFYFVSMNSKK